MLEKKPRILITGCPIGGATEKVIRAVEDNGGVVVTYENCTGAKSIDRLVDENAEGYLPGNCREISGNRLFSYDTKPESF